MNKNYWCGIRGVYQIWHGQWADPEVRYKNYICNEWDLQDSMYITMKDRIADGEDWGDPDNDRDFMNFCKQNADLVKQDIMELSTGGVYESKNIMLRKNNRMNETSVPVLSKKAYSKQLDQEKRNKRDIKVALIPTDALDYEWDFRPTEVTNDRFLDLANQYGKVYYADDFEYIWNDVDCPFNCKNSYIKIIKD